MQFSHKAEKEGKPHGKNPPPKREKKRMHEWSNQDPPIMTYIHVQKRMMRGRETEEVPPPKEECRPMTAPMKKLIPECRIVFLHVGSNNAQGTDETLPLCMERICLKEMSDSATDEELCCNC